MRIGVDLGGTKTEAVVMDRDGVIRHRIRVETARAYRASVAQIAALVAALEEQAGCRCSVGVATPGSASPHTGLMRNANSTWLNGQPLQRDLEAALGRPVRLANDADCFALSEAHDGAGAQGRVVFGVILGTGVGGGLVVERRLIGGANGVAGEWGHTPLPWMTREEHPGPGCWCGKAGCIETWLSGPGWAAWHEARFGEALAPPAIAARAAEGCAACGESLALYADRLGRALAMIVSILDPDVIVLGGGLSRIEALYRLAPPVIAAHAFSDVVEVRLAPNAHGDSSGVRGAAWLWEPAP